VRGLRVGSFSQSALVVPLREMEQGLEELRRAEAEAAAVDSKHSRAPGTFFRHLSRKLMCCRLVGTLDFDFNDFLIGLDPA
jgi:hypothetical protein